MDGGGTGMIVPVSLASRAQVSIFSTFKFNI